MNAREGFDQGFVAGGAVDKLAGAGTHGGDDGGRLIHLADGKNSDVGNAGVDEFDGANGALRVARIDIDQDDFGALVLQLPQNGVARPEREAGLAHHGASQMRAFDTGVQDDGLFAVLGEDGDCDSVHESILRVQGHVTNFPRRNQVTFVIGNRKERRSRRWLR